MEKVLLEINGDASDLDIFYQDIKEKGKVLEKKTPETNGDQLYFDLTDPQTIKAVLEAAVVLNTLIVAIRKWFAKPDKKRIVIKTPTGTVTFEAAGQMDEKEVADKLETLIRVIQK